MRLREHPAIGEGRTDILPADPRQLSIMEGYNVRDLTTAEARAELDELKAQVKEHGVKTALVVRFDGEKIWIVEGHRRHKVALELIEEYERSKGSEGRKIEYVPIKAEAPGTSEIDRDFGLETSNSGKPLKPLELANLIYRLREQRGLPMEKIAAGLGKSIVVVKNTLALRAMPETVKAEVNNGTIAATTANKLLKNLPAGTDPDKALEIIKAAADEKRRLGKKGRATPKAVTQEIERRKPKVQAQPEPPKEEPKDEPATPAPIMAPNAEVEPRAPSFTPPMVPASEARSVDSSSAPEIHDGGTDASAPTPVRVFAPEAMRPPSPAQDYDREMFSIICRLATIAEESCIGERADDEPISVPAEVIKAADRAYRSKIGDTVS